MPSCRPAPRISVVVPTCGRPALLARCLAALELQSLPAEAFEVLVVDDSRLRSGPAAARNRGWRSARAAVVAFTDDDTIPDAGWLEEGLKAIEAGADAVTGRTRVPIDDSPTDYERDVHGMEGSEFVTANCFVRRRVLESLGGFDERFPIAWREDSDLHFRLLASGARLERAPRAIVVHPVRPAPWGVSVRQQRKVMFDALLFKKHRRLYRQRIRAAIRWDYYLMTLALVLALAGFGAAAAAWLAGTALFCLKRLRGASKRPRHVLEVLVTSVVIPPLAVFWRLVGALRYRVAFL